MKNAYGCDISKWQDKPDTQQKVNFKKMKAAGASFVFCKASQGLTTDSKFLEYWQNSKGILPRGAYHFLRFTMDGKKQAEYMWSLLEKDPGELPPVCDFEKYPNETPPESAMNYLWAFVETIERLSGKIPIIYTGAYFWEQYCTQNILWQRYPLWIAGYYMSLDSIEAMMEKRTPWNAWHFWQFTDKGDGLAHGVESLQIDMNYFNGTEEQLYHTFKIKMAKSPLDLLRETANRIWERREIREGGK